MKRFTVILMLMAACCKAVAGVPVVKNIKLSTGVRLQYAEQGSKNGIPVILIHGYTDSWYSFRATLQYLPADFHVFAITMRGHGDSDRPLYGYGLTDFSNDIAAFIEKMKLGPAVIVGHSMGGMIAQQFSLLYPALTRSLVIISSDACFKDNPGLPEFKAQIDGLDDPVRYEFASEFQQATIASPIDKSYYRILVGETLKVPSYVWKETMTGIMEADLSKAISLITKPTLICWGEKDMFCSRADQEILLKGITQATFLVYENTGHALHWEKPERFANDLTDFIRSL